VLAPEGTAARPMAPDSRTTSTSTVGFPRESIISRARISEIVLINSNLNKMPAHHRGDPRSVKGKGRNGNGRRRTGGRVFHRHQRTPKRGRRPMMRVKYVSFGNCQLMDRDFLPLSTLKSFFLKQNLHQKPESAQQVVSGELPHLFRSLRSCISVGFFVLIWDLHRTT